MVSEGRTAINWRGITRTGLAYGGGLMMGSLFSQFLLSVLSPKPYRSLGKTAPLIIGIALVLFITGIVGAIGGFLGGWTLPVIGKANGKYGFAWRSAISLGIVSELGLILAIFGLTLLSTRAAAFVPIGPFMQVYLLVGLIMGALTGLLLGLASVGWRRTGSVIIAGTVGFGLGGAALGAGIWAYLDSASIGAIYEGDHILLLIGLFAFGLLGGLAFGFAFDRLARKDTALSDAPPRTWRRYVVYALVGLSVPWLLIQLRPLWAFAGDMLAPRAALETERIEADSIGVSWQASLPITAAHGEVVDLDLAAGEPGEMALVWSEGNGSVVNAYLQVGQTAADGEIAWEWPINVSDSTADSYKPGLAIDASRAIHVAWLEGESKVPSYSRCTDGQCIDPLAFTNTAVNCASGIGAPDTASIDIAAAANGTVMAVWSDLPGGLQYRALPNDAPNGAPFGVGGCVPLPEEVATGAFSLVSRPSGGFSLVFDNMRDGIWMTEFSDAGWDPAAVKVGQGLRPDLLVTENGMAYIVWCSKGGGVEFWSEGQTEVLSRLSCQGAPSVAIDGDGLIHVVWQSDQVEDVLGTVRGNKVLYETIGDGQSWSEPAIVARLEALADYKMVAGSAGELHLAWTGIDPAILYARKPLYNCDPQTLSGPEFEMYKVASLGGYRPEDDVIPYCQNRYEMMLFTPAVDPAFSDADPTLNGAYDNYAELMQTADFEALFTTMIYTKSIDQDSPGAVLARGVVDLYQKVKANPENYPRGMLVRILLGHSLAPSLQELEVDGGLWYVLDDLKEAGLEKMIDSELGWRVEVGNFAGNLPYSHVKTLIIDGETVVASGFNHEHKPLSKDHPSGKGLGDIDTGLVVTGPVAQHSRRIFDQLWTGAYLRHCPDLTASEVELRQSCSDSRGVPDHVPEAMRYSPSDDDAIAFSMFRNRVYDEADRLLLAAFGSAGESIDVAQAMFSMPMVCNINHFFEVCDFDQAPPFMEALMEAAENGVALRIVLTPYPFQFVENVIAMELFNKEAAERGLADQVEIRMLGDLLHSKSAIIDGEFIVVGSQNLHWSAFGEDTGLSEYNLGIGDPNAAEQYQRFFDYLWQRSPSRAESIDQK